MTTEAVNSPAPPTEFQRFYEHLKSKARGEKMPDCPICGSGVWSNPGLSETPSKVWGSGQAGVLRTIPVICETCGFTMLFSESVVNAET